MFGRRALAMDLKAVRFRSVGIHRLRKRVMELVLALSEDGHDFTGFDVDFEALEAQTAQAQYTADYSAALCSANKHKNRYSNVLPPEATRVRLSVSNDSDQGADTDYINANDVVGRDLPRRIAQAHAQDVQANGGVDPHPWVVPRYIATQGPLEWTIGDFWRMIWERNVSVVVMLTRDIENGRVKCDRYWPLADAPLVEKRFRVEHVSCDETEELLTRCLRITNLQSNENRIVTQFQYLAWPDHGLPPSTTAYLALSHMADEANTTHGPLVVHCSAGIGRSGTFCTVHSSMELIEWQVQEQVRKHGRIVEPPRINIGKTVMHLRKQRPGMIQTREQYMFCFLAIMEEGERLLDEWCGDENGPGGSGSSSSSSSNSGSSSEDDYSMSDDDDDGQTHEQESLI